MVWCAEVRRLWVAGCVQACGCVAAWRGVWDGKFMDWWATVGRVSAACNSRCRGGPLACVLDGWRVPLQQMYWLKPQLAAEPDLQ